MAPEYWEDISKAIETERRAQKEVRDEAQRRLAKEQALQDQRQVERGVLQREVEKYNETNRQRAQLAMQRLIALLNDIKGKDSRVLAAPHRELVTFRELSSLEGVDNNVELRWGNKLRPTPEEKIFLGKYKYRTLRGDLGLMRVPESIIRADYFKIPVIVYFDHRSGVFPYPNHLTNFAIPEWISVGTEAIRLDTRVPFNDFERDWHIIFPLLARSLLDPVRVYDRLDKGKGYWENRPPSYPYMPPQNNP